MIVFNKITVFQTTSEKDSIEIEYVVTNGETVDKIWIDDVTNACNMRSTDDLNHTIVLADSGLFATPGTITITPTELTTEGYSDIVFDEMKIIGLLDTVLSVTDQYAYYDLSHLYYSQISLLNATTDIRLDLRQREKLILISAKESLLKNAQVLNLAEDCVTYFAQINLLADYDKYTKGATSLETFTCESGNGLY